MFRPRDDPYRDNPKYHMAGLIRRTDGAVSALCFKRPRPINLEEALWTTDWSAVTCKNCLRLKPKDGLLLENGPSRGRAARTSAQISGGPPRGAMEREVSDG
jgi:hypothetical protein